MSAAPGIRTRIRQLLRSVGISLGRYDPRRDPEVVRRQMLRRLGVTTVLDVGANSGQFALQMRREGFRGRIISFEPLSTAFVALERAAAGDPLWHVHRCAVGGAPGEVTINVAGNSWSSSILPMLDLHRDAAPESVYIGAETVRVATLDGEVAAAGNLAPGFLKIDTQGYTMPVLEGATGVLRHMAAVQVELSLAPLYEGEPLIGDVVTWLYARGFRLVLIEPEFTDGEGRQLQVNGLFVAERP